MGASVVAVTMLGPSTSSPATVDRECRTFIHVVAPHHAIVESRAPQLSAIVPVNVSATAARPSCTVAVQPSPATLDRPTCASEQNSRVSEALSERSWERDRLDADAPRRCGAVSPWRQMTSQCYSSNTSSWQRVDHVYVRAAVSDAGPSAAGGGIDVLIETKSPIGEACDGDTYIGSLEAVGCATEPPVTPLHHFAIQPPTLWSTSFDYCNGSYSLHFSPLFAGIAALSTCSWQLRLYHSGTAQREWWVPTGPPACSVIAGDRTFTLSSLPRARPAPSFKERVPECPAGVDCSWTASVAADPSMWTRVMPARSSTMKSWSAFAGWVPPAIVDAAEQQYTPAGLAASSSSGDVCTHEQHARIASSNGRWWPAYACDALTMKGRRMPIAGCYTPRERRPSYWPHDNVAWVPDVLAEGTAACYQPDWTPDGVATALKRRGIRSILFVGDSLTRNLADEFISFLRGLAATWNSDMSPSQEAQVSKRPITGSEGDTSGTFLGITVRMIQSWGMAETFPYNLTCGQGMHLFDKQKKRVSRGMHFVQHAMHRLQSCPLPDMLVVGSQAAHDVNAGQPYPLHAGIDLLEQMYHLLRARGFNGSVLFREASVKSNVPWGPPSPGGQWWSWIGNADAQDRVARRYGWHTIRTMDLTVTRPDRFYDSLHLRPSDTKMYPRTARMFTSSASSAILRRMLHLMYSMPEVA